MRLIIFLLLIITSIQTSLSKKEVKETSDQEIKFLIRSFIPKEIIGSTDLIKKIDDQYILKGPKKECFQTDNRGFSNSLNESFRTQTIFTIKIKNGKVSINPSPSNVHSIANSSKVDCETGEIISIKMGEIEISSIGRPIFADNKVQIIGQVAGNNPHLASPWIDISFDFIYDIKNKKLIYSIQTGQFPSFEVYVSLNNEDFQDVIRINANNSPWELFDFGLGFNSKNHTGDINF